MSDIPTRFVVDTNQIASRPTVGDGVYAGTVDVVMYDAHVAAIAERDRLFAETVEALNRLHAETLDHAVTAAYDSGQDDGRGIGQYEGQHDERDRITTAVKALLPSPGDHPWIDLFDVLAVIKEASDAN
jgi:hypothetical protein